MNGCVNGLGRRGMKVLMDEWMNELGGWMEGWADVRIGWIGEWMDGWKDGRADSVNGWMDWVVSGWLAAWRDGRVEEGLEVGWMFGGRDGPTDVLTDGGMNERKKKRRNKEMESDGR